MPFLSIIVPVYNVEKYLEECLDSILAQTFTDYELILVNDGSTDNSYIICEEYKKRYSKIRVINKNNGGQTSARKAGVAIAKGTYIGFVDSDDKIEPSMYQKLCDEAIKNSADIVICDVWQWDGERKTKIVQNLPGGIFSKEQLEQEIYPNMLYAGHYYQFGFLPAMWNKIYKSELLKRNQMLVDERIRIGEDAACSYMCILEANRVSYIKNVYEYYYRLNRNSMCQNWTNRNISSASILLDYLYERLAGNNSDNIMEQYWYYYSYMFTNMLYDYGESVRRKQIVCNVDDDFKELLSSKSYQVFKSYYKTIKIPFYRKIVANSMIHGRMLDTIMWKVFVRLRAFITKCK